MVSTPAAAPIPTTVSTPATTKSTPTAATTTEPPSASATTTAFLLVEVRVIHTLEGDLELPVLESRSVQFDGVFDRLLRLNDGGTDNVDEKEQWVQQDKEQQVVHVGESEGSCFWGFWLVLFVEAWTTLSLHQVSGVTQARVMTIDGIHVIHRRTKQVNERSNKRELWDEIDKEPVLIDPI